jgi:hypothetical protein
MSPTARATNAVSAAIDTPMRTMRLGEATGELLFF